MRVCLQLKFTLKRTLTYISLAISISHLSSMACNSFKITITIQHQREFKCKPKRHKSNRNESSRIGLDFHPVFINKHLLNGMNSNIYLYFIGFFIHFTVKQQLKLKFLCIPFYRMKQRVREKNSSGIKYFCINLHRGANQPCVYALE